jgi:hypothetical protein
VKGTDKKQVPAPVVTDADRRLKDLERKLLCANVCIILLAAAGICLSVKIRLLSSVVTELVQMVSK